MGSAHQFQGLGRSGGPLGGVADGSALHEHDWLQTIAAHQGGRKPQHVAGLQLLEDCFKGGGGDVVTLVDDHLPVVLHHGVHLPLPHQGLHHGDVEAAGGFDLAATDATDRFSGDV